MLYGAVGEDSLGEPPVDSYGLAIAYLKQQQQQQHSRMALRARHHAPEMARP